MKSCLFCQKLKIYFPDWTRLAEPEPSKEETCGETEGEKTENKQTESEVVPSETQAAESPVEETKPVDEEMKDLSDSKPTSEEEEKKQGGEEKEGKEKEQGEEEKEDKQEVIPPPADSAEDLEVPSSNKRKSPRKVTRISVEGEEYRTNSGTVYDISPPILAILSLYVECFIVIMHFHRLFPVIQLIFMFSYVILYS